LPAAGFFTFIEAFIGAWVDPPLAFGYEYEMLSDSLFTAILDFPTGFDNSFTVSVDGIPLPGAFGPGDSVVFEEGVRKFSITGISPLVDAESPDVFPVRLAFSTSSASFTMRPLISSQIEIVAEKDSFLRKGDANRNEGANPRLRFEASGTNRVVVGFDLAAIDPNTVTKATLILTIAENADNWGANNDRTVAAHPLLEVFAEGNGKHAGLPRGASTRGTGPGATWNCAIDAEIANPQTDCAPGWNGGTSGPATAAPVVHVNGLSGPVEWDVTLDVQQGATAWLVKKTNERLTGKVWYYSREGAVDAWDPAVAPQLMLEFQ
jgi:hypothetical protein